MRDDLSIPPLRDLPPGRLAQRRGHLLFEITRERESRGLARLWSTRWRRPRRRRIVVFAATALVAVVGTASAFSTVREFILDRGFIGLPPEGATPSSPESGEVVLRWVGESATHAQPDWRGRAQGLPPPPQPWLRGFDAPNVRASVYADGRIIWQRDRRVPDGANEITSGYLEQRLTPEGVELLRSEVVGLLDRSRALLETVPADDPGSGPFGGLALFVPRDYPSWHGSVQVRDGERIVRLQWREVGLLGDPRRRFEGTIATPEQLSALRQIDALLTDPASVLPSSAWAVREVRAYVPSHYAVCIDTAPPNDLAELLTLLPTRAADLLRDEIWTRRGGEVVEAREGYTVVLGQSVSYCSKLVTDEARRVANAVSGLPRHPWPFTLIYDVADAVNNLEPTTISFDPYFPDGQFAPYDGGR